MRITARDRALLGYVAEHRLVLVAHARAFMGTTAAGAYQRLAALSQTGLLSRHALYDRRPGCYQITRRGLAAIDSDLPAPRLDLRCYHHDVGVAWLWLAAARGVFGGLERVVSERRMRSHDAPAQISDGLGMRPFAVRLGGLGPGGRPRLHYPDLLLVDRCERRIALELELTSKGRTRREQILMGYGGDAQFHAVLYLCPGGAVQRTIRSSAARVGVASLVHVQRLRWGVAEGQPGGHAARERGSGRAVAAAR